MLRHDALTLSFVHEDGHVVVRWTSADDLSDLPEEPAG